MIYVKDFWKLTNKGDYRSPVTQQ